jgi:hypothetical protein
VEIKNNLNPVGTVANVPGFNDLVEKMKAKWLELKKQIGDTNAAIVIQFLSKCLDDLIVYLVEHQIPGQDKKATVINAFSKIYDVVVVGSLPIFLRPFNSTIKNFVINVLLSHFIDFIVEKYNSGSWSPKATTSVLAFWGVKN